MHTACKKGTRVKLVFKDGREPVIDKFKDKKAKYIFTENGKYAIKDVRVMMIYKSKNMKSR